MTFSAATTLVGVVEAAKLPKRLMKIRVIEVCLHRSAGNVVIGLAINS